MRGRRWSRLLRRHGLGKTLIKQGFCQWLNPFEAPGNCWPDTLFGVDGGPQSNPIFEGRFQPCSIDSSFHWMAHPRVPTSSNWPAAWRRRGAQPYTFYALSIHPMRCLPAAKTVSHLMA